MTLFSQNTKHTGLRTGALLFCFLVALVVFLAWPIPKCFPDTSLGRGGMALTKPTCVELPRFTVWQMTLVK